MYQLNIVVVVPGEKKYINKLVCMKILVGEAYVGCCEAMAEAGRQGGESHNSQPGLLKNEVHSSLRAT